MFLLMIKIPYLTFLSLEQQIEICMHNISERMYFFPMPIILVLNL